MAERNPSMRALQYCPPALVPPLAPQALRNRDCQTPLKLRRREIPLSVKWEQFVPEYLPSVENVSFVLVGASCGANVRECAIGGDPIWNYAVACGWRGVAIEPVWNMFQRLCHHYGRFTRQVVPIHALIADTRGDAIVVNRGETSHMVRQRTPSGQQRNSNRSLTPRPERREELVSSLTLHHVWPATAGAPVLVVDAEGSEPVILGHGDLPTPSPSLVLFEHVHLSDADKEGIDRNLLRQGYHKLADIEHKDRAAGELKLGAQDRLYGKSMA